MLLFNPGSWLTSYPDACSRSASCLNDTISYYCGDGVSCNSLGLDVALDKFESSLEGLNLTCVQVRCT